MFTASRLLWAGSLAVTALLLGGQPAGADDKKKPADEGIVVQPRGPIHEAFAQPQNKEPVATPTVAKQPPAPVPEEPPDEKPKGDNVQWMPGYWAWDVDKKDYLWISGFWRMPPPDQKWKPGYWHEVNNGWQWVPGYWTAAGQEQPTYLPKPPASLEVGPSVPAPDDEQFYNPGRWVYQSSGYVWRPGFWSRAHRGWVWNSPYYLSTPAGYVYVDGYWDYPLEDRGLLFAPVYFNEPLWQTPGWYYQPGFVVGFDGLFGSLFVRPGCYHYYYGDYYDPFYAGLGFYPWYSYGLGFYDPLFGYYRWHYRHNPGWFSGLHNDFLARRNGTLARPGNSFVTPLNQFHSQNQQLARVTPSQFADQRVNAQNLREESFQRRRAETAPAGTPGVRVLRADAPGTRVERQAFAQGSGNFTNAASAFRGERIQPEHMFQQSTRSAWDQHYSTNPGNWRGPSSFSQSRMGSSPSFHGGGGGGMSRGGGGGGHGGGHR